MNLQVSDIEYTHRLAVRLATTLVEDEGIHRESFLYIQLTAIYLIRLLKRASLT